MSHPMTAIIVLSYNGIRVTQKFLRHLYDHTDQDRFQLIMIDNGSTDGSAEYLDKFAFEHENVIYIANDHNKAVIGGRNQGYDMLCSLADPPEYLCFLDNDQYVLDGWLTHHHEVLASNNYDLIGVEAWTLNRDFYPFRQCKTLKQTFSYVGCGGMLMKKKVPDDIGMFDPQFNPCYFEDPDFCFRAREAGYFMGWNIAAKVIHLPHQTLGKNNKRMLHFRQSHSKFKAKWKKKRFQPVGMANLPQFQENYVCEK